MTTARVIQRRSQAVDVRPEVDLIRRCDLLWRDVLRRSADQSSAGQLIGGASVLGAMRRNPKVRQLRQPIFADQDVIRFLVVPKTLVAVVDAALRKGVRGEARSGVRPVAAVRLLLAECRSL